MTDDILLTVQEEPDITLEYVEAAIKPETVGHVTPKRQAQTVYPASGTVFGSVEVDPMPNPVLQNTSITPTKQKQTATADSGFDGLGTVEVEPIPSEYIIPQGKTIIPQNGTFNVAQYEEAEVDVSSDPEIGFVLEGWNEKGQPTTLRLCGFTNPPDWYFYPFAGQAVDNSRGYFCNRLTTVILNEGIVRIWYYVFRDMRTIQRVVFPSTIRTIQGWAFFGDNALNELDFSSTDEIPSLDSPGQLGHATGCVIKVPSSLLSAWQTATNWNALTGVVWEGV